MNRNHDNLPAAKSAEKDIRHTSHLALQAFVILKEFAMKYIEQDLTYHLFSDLFTVEGLCNVSQPETSMEKIP